MAFVVISSEKTKEKENFTIKVLFFFGLDLFFIFNPEP